MIKNLSNEYILEIADNAVNHLSNNDYGLFLDSLKPILNSKCPFYKLDLIGKRIGNKFLKQEKSRWGAVTNSKSGHIKKPLGK